MILVRFTVFMMFYPPPVSREVLLEEFQRQEGAEVDVARIITPYSPLPTKACAAKDWK